MEGCKGNCCSSASIGHSVQCRYEYALSRLGLTDTPHMRVLFWDANDELEWDEENDSYIIPEPIPNDSHTK